MPKHIRKSFSQLSVSIVLGAVTVTYLWLCPLFPQTQDSMAIADDTHSVTQFLSVEIKSPGRVVAE